jgi:hypothetical protein
VGAELHKTKQKTSTHGWGYYIIFVILLSAASSLSRCGLLLLSVYHMECSCLAFLEKDINHSAVGTYLCERDGIRKTSIYPMRYRISSFTDPGMISFVRSWRIEGPNRT